jgi:hypothetical protein
MTKAGRIFELAQGVAFSYDLLNARRAGSGDTYTREVIDHLKFVVQEEFGSGVTNQFLSKVHRESVDFWLKEEQTILEVEFSLLGLAPVLEREVFKALLAKDAGHKVRHLILIGDPGSIRRFQAPNPRSIMEWVERQHQIAVEVWDLNEKKTS